MEPILSYRQAFTKVIILIAFFTNINNNFAQEGETLINLKGGWRFSIGDNSEWSSPHYNAKDWELIPVPGNWEDKGYNGYNGYAWYRKTVVIPEEYKTKSLVLDLGYIDDVDEVYMNGKLIGYTGSFPPHYSSAYNAHRAYYLPSEYLNFDGRNVISVRVFDSYGEGGMVSGNIRIFEIENPMPLDINLQGIWHFKTGDDMQWKKQEQDNANWLTIMVPGNWENLGYNDYDGYAWYRKTITIEKDLADQDILLVLGKIDDLDQAYVNEVLIGSTGVFYNDPRIMHTSNEWSRSRIYEIPRGVLKADSKNTICIRVYDGQLGGGIYKGPVGFISKEKYLKYRQNMKD